MLSIAVASRVAIGRSAAAARNLPEIVRAASTSPDGPLHRSRIPTFHFQDSLPRLPVPKLEDTLTKYREFVTPLLTSEQAKATEAAITAFGQGQGPALQAKLEQWAKEHKETSYISAMWFDMYLQNRDPLLLNLNPQITWVDQEAPAKMEQATRAADLIHTAVRFHLALERQCLEPDVFHTKEHISKAPWFQQLVALTPRAVSWYAGFAAGAYALDMSQYARLFKSTREPHIGTDTLTTATASDHVVLQRGPRFYRIKVKEGDRAVPVTAIEAQVRAVLADSKGATYAAEPPVGALTAWHRDQWSDARDALRLNPVNAASLAAIDSSLFLVTLDDSKPTSHEDLSRAMLHGDARNRWYDKCLNLIVCANGKAGINWEHAWGDGVAVLYFFNEVHKGVSAMATRDPTPAAPAASVERLRFDTSEATVSSAIAAAEAYSDSVIGATELRVYQSASMTKDDIKRSKLSPDGVMQMILQLAHWRAHGVTPSTYESASTAGFKHGRTETIRPVTPASVAMCKAFSDPAVDGVARYKALKAATARHKQVSYECLLGKGVDRHLFALGKWAEREGGGKADSMPQLFTDDGYRIFKDIRLSTSTLASPALQGGGFGPVSRTSYGVGYGTDERGAHFHVMNYTKREDGAPSGTVNGAFVEGAESALKDFREAIAAAVKAGAIDAAGGK